MRVFALSDLHADHASNFEWLGNLSAWDYREDVLILAGDITDSLQRLDECFRLLVARFARVLFVPGNHELWVVRDKGMRDSFEKFESVGAHARECGVSMQPFTAGDVSIVPLLGWYDFSFQPPSEELLERWSDFRACRWNVSDAAVTAHFLKMNEPALELKNRTLISFSHFLPRIDLMPPQIPPRQRLVYPVLGTHALERQIRHLGSSIHVYGHSHVNRRVQKDGVLYVNNAFGYPHERHITGKRLLCIHEA